MTELQIITGPMFSGKSEELLRRLSRYPFRPVPPEVFLFKPITDSRGEEELVSSHSGSSMSCVPVKNVFDISQYLQSLDGTVYDPIIGIDEGQFLNGIKELYLDLCNFYDDATLIIAGLNRDYQGRPFPAMERLFSYADKIDILEAICRNCGHMATETYRVSKGTDLIEIDTGDNYEARCKECHAK